LPQAKDACRRALEVQDQLVRRYGAEIPTLEAELVDIHHNLGETYAQTNEPDQAAEEYRQALKIGERLHQQHPESPTYAVKVGTIYGSLGLLTRDQHQAETPLGWYGQAIGTLEAVLSKVPNKPEAKQALTPLYWDRAHLLPRLTRYADPVRDWDKALKLTPDPLQHASFGARRAAVIARQSDHARAVAEARTLAQGNSASAEV